MNWERRPEEDTPTAEQRRFQDDQGRTWVGTLTSGSVAGGEQHGEVIFVCEDDPNEVKRVGRMEAAPAEAADEWKRMDEPGVRSVFDGSSVR